MLCLSGVVVEQGKTSCKRPAGLLMLSALRAFSNVFSTVSARVTGRAEIWHLSFSRSMRVKGY